MRAQLRQVRTTAEGVIDIEDRDLDRYLCGDALYGDDFGPLEIAAWYDDEKEGYAELGAEDAETYSYAYHALNIVHGFRYLPPGSFRHALGFGSAYAHEFAPVAERVERLTIVDPSDAFRREQVFGVPSTYVKPQVEGTLPFPAGSFDLITCLGVLHHIPNVTFVMSELHRCLRDGGALLLREPIISMGDWRRPRPGLTRRERGIPLPILRRIVQAAGFSTLRETLCMFPLLRRLGKALGFSPYSHVSATILDSWMSLLFSWNLRYHATSALHKLRPTCVYLVLSK